MQVEVNLRTVPIEGLVEAARMLEHAGVDVIADSEVRRDPMLTMALLAGSTGRVGLASAVSIAFARSPMVLAYGARNINAMSHGRFHLGLGTQVKQHVLRRFSGEWSSPGPRFRDYVQAVRDVWAAWEGGGPLEHRSEHYMLDLMTPEFDLGPDSYRAVPIELAAVNAFNVGVAARLADGLRLHAFTTPAFIREVVRPNVESQAMAAGRHAGAVELIGGGFIATGSTDQQVESARETARRRIGFYGSTRTYRTVLDHHGWSDLGDELRHLSDAGEWEKLGSTVPDEVLETFVTCGTYEELIPLLQERYLGVVDRIQLPWPGGEDNSRVDWDGFGCLVARVRGLGPSSGPSGADERSN